MPPMESNCNHCLHERLGVQPSGIVIRDERGIIVLTRLIVVPLIAVLATFAGCSPSRTEPIGNDNENGGGGGGATTVLSTDSLDALGEVSADFKTLRFTAATSQLRGLRANNVIAAPPHPPLLPYGALRRVVSVSTEGETIVVPTEFLALADVIEQGSIHAELALDDPLPTDSAKIQPLLAGPGQLVFPLDNTVLFDADNDLTTTNDQIVLDGNIAIEPDVVIDIDIDGFALQHASVELQGEITANITVTAKREATITPLDKTLIPVPFSPVVIPVGPIPVVLVPILEIHAGASGSFSADLTADLDFEGDAAVGLAYENGSFGPVLELAPDGSAAVPGFEEGAKAAGKVWISAKFKVAVYGLAGVFAELALYGRATVDVDACPWWELYVGVDGSAGAFAEINVDVVFVPFDSSIEIFEWETNPLNAEELVADAGECAPSSAPGDVITWARSYGADSIDFPVALAVTPDGGSVVAGGTDSFTAQRDALLMKLDAFGHIAWQMGYDDLEAAIAVRPVDDGYFLLAGETTVSSFYVPPFLPDTIGGAIDPPVYLLRLDLNGIPVWARAIGSSEASLDAIGLALLPNGHVVVAGTLGDPPDSEDIWLARFDPDGEVVWAKRHEDPGTQTAESLIVDSAGDIVVLGSSGVTCDLLYKLGADGTLFWRGCYGSSHNNFATELVENSGGYTLVGHLSNDAQINRVDLDGHLLWARHLDSDVHEVIEMPDGSIIEAADETPYDEAYAAAAFSDGDVLITGKVDLGEDADLWALRVADDGQGQWIRQYGGSREDVGGGWLEFARTASTVATTADGGALLGGFSKTFSHAADATAFDLDIWILKIRGTGIVELDAASGASAGAVFGEIYDVSHFGGPDSDVTLTSLDLLVGSFTPYVFSPTLETARQGGPE